MTETIGELVRTRWGVIPRIIREGNVIAFRYSTIGGQRDRGIARRCAVAWISDNPQLQRGVTGYRFDVGSIRDAF